MSRATSAGTPSSAVTNRLSDSRRLREDSRASADTLLVVRDYQGVELPTGTVTFLFTDIEGSTRLLAELGEGYAVALAEHRPSCVGRSRVTTGVEVDTQGDAFFVAFGRATDAVAAAAEAQGALAGGAVRVRMGLHTGEPLVTDEGYVGIDVHRAARVAAAGHGGQVLLSQPTRDLVEVEVRDLGLHRLKDLSASEHLFQLGAVEFPPLKTLYQTNLPVQPSPLVGRERDIALISGFLRDGDAFGDVDGSGWERQDAACAAYCGGGRRRVPRWCLVCLASSGRRSESGRARPSRRRSVCRARCGIPALEAAVVGAGQLRAPVGREHVAGRATAAAPEVRVLATKEERWRIVLVVLRR